MSSGLNAGDWNAVFAEGIINTINTATGINALSGITLYNSWTLQSAAILTVGGTLNFTTGAFWIYGVPAPSNSFLVTNSLGNISTDLFSNYISNHNTQTGYTAFTNGATLRTCNTATVTLQQLAQIVGTIVEDIKAVKLLAT